MSHSSLTLYDAGSRATSVRPTVLLGLESSILTQEACDAVAEEIDQRRADPDNRSRRVSWFYLGRDTGEASHGADTEKPGAGVAHFRVTDEHLSDNFHQHFGSLQGVPKGLLAVTAASQYAVHTLVRAATMPTSHTKEWTLRVTRGSWNRAHLGNEILPAFTWVTLFEGDSVEVLHTAVGGESIVVGRLTVIQGPVMKWGFGVPDGPYYVRDSQVPTEPSSVESHQQRCADADYFKAEVEHLRSVDPQWTWPSNWQAVGAVQQLLESGEEFESEDMYREMERQFGADAAVTWGEGRAQVTSYALKISDATAEKIERDFAEPRDLVLDPQHGVSDLVLQATGNLTYKNGQGVWPLYAVLGGRRDIQLVKGKEMSVSDILRRCAQAFAEYEIVIRGPQA